MAPPTPARPRAFVDADVLFAGAASPSDSSASLVVLRLAELTLIEGVTSEQVIAEAERNLAAKLATALPTFRLIVNRCLRVVPNPEPADLQPYSGQAHPQDLPILVAALREECQWLVTFNVRHFHPRQGCLSVVRPAEFVLRVRDLLGQMGRRA